MRCGIIEAASRQADEEARRRWLAEAPPTPVALPPGGKRLRGELVLRCAAHLSGREPDSLAVTAAAMVEVMHAATLVHDDVVDAASTRRGQATLNARHGNAVAGYAGALALAVSIRALDDLPEWAAAATQSAFAAVCDGQWRETVSAFDADRDTESYLAAVRGKTGELFGLAAFLGARLGGATETAAAPYAATARELGVAYQIIDDVLDISPAAGGRGKPPGADLRAGVVTLPVILARERDARICALLRVLRDRREAADEIAALARAGGGRYDALDVAARMVAGALCGLDAEPFDPLLDLLRREALLVSSR